jgi:very-short-patch-repair endonuclease
MPPEYDPRLRDQVIRLMGVLRQLAVSRNRPIRNTASYDSVLWLGEAQEHCAIHIPDGPGAELMRAPRIPRENEPGAPPILRGWLTTPPGGGEMREPILRRQGRLGGRPVDLTDAPEVQSAFDTWIRTAWRPWAERQRGRRPRQRVFEMLFDLSRLAADRPESIELVLSSGLLHVPGPADEESVHVHLVTQPVRVEQDAETGEMVCTLADEVGMRLEDDELLSGLPMFDSSGATVLRERLLELAESPVAPQITTFLKEWAPRALTIACDITDTWAEPAKGEIQARLAVAPAIVARRRGAFALRAYYDKIAKDLADDGQPIPLGLAQLVRSVEPADRIEWLERSGATAPADLADDPLFPLPANEEQARIIERLGSDTGVVVEGPPGTGKTHTIANLVSALLARGQRILVTSEKAQALRVLRDKLPPEMQELCVSITDASPKGKSDLAKSVATLAGERTDFNPHRADRRIEDLAARREEARRRRAAVLEEIRALRESETYQHPEIAPGYGGTLASIARTITQTAERDGWVHGYARGELPLAGQEITDLLHLLQAESPERRSRITQELPDPDELLAADRFEQLVAHATQGDALRSGQDGPLVATLEELPAEALVRLEPVCRTVVDAALWLRQVQPQLVPWAHRTSDMLLAGNGLHLWHQAVGQLGMIGQAQEHDRRADFARVQVADSVDPADAAPVFERLAAYLAQGGAFKKVFKSGEQKAAEQFGDAVLVIGSPPTSERAAAAAGHHLRVHEIAIRLDTALRPLDMGLPLRSERPMLIDAMLGIQHTCAAVDSLRHAAASLWELLAILPAPKRPFVTSVAALHRVASVTSAVTRARSSAVAAVEIEARADQMLAGAPTAERSPEAVALADAMRRHDVESYERGLGAIVRARRQQADQRQCDELLLRLRAASILLAEELEATASDPVWPNRLPYWPNAWARACAASWMAERTAPGREQQLDDELNAAVGDVHKLTSELAAACSWRACLGRMNAEQVQALQSYRNAMANVGKGTGKYAERYRQAARDAMAVAQAAVPAWVMPIQQVLASVPPQADSFDVVIVDEASQADLTSAFLLWLAPRVIVVGDDKQCTPSEVASGALQQIFDRLDAELHDLPSYLRAAFTPRDSIFSLLRSRFGQVVRLREHFRCMPEIINWSSNMFYRDAPLVPLRQFGADRLPPLQTMRVPGAETTPTRGSYVNRAEAAAIAESVAQCVADPAYEGRSFGVVVLQGHPQVDLVNQELRQRIRDEEWAKRRLRVGTPPDFQGDERHVVWLSMVVAPNTKSRSLTARDSEQSFNVAVSRAQDQLWLFHSVTPDLLNSIDLRHSLLTYMLTAGGSAIDPVLAGVEPDRRHDAFDSLFEQRVFLDLVARGYHVTPQFESNGRRIDLVVTGAAGKLAVECDGEAFHTTVEQRAADLAREQELKRCGWTFERIRESAYYLDREAALAPVWSALDRLKIGPLAGFVDGTWAPLPPSPPAHESMVEGVAVLEPAPTAETFDVEDLPDRLYEPSSTDTDSTDPSVALPFTVVDRRSAGHPILVDDAAVPAPVELSPALLPSATPTAVETPPAGISLPPPAGRPRHAVPEPAEPEVSVVQPVEAGFVAEDRELLLQAAARRPLTSRLVADTLAISANEARELLRSMVQEGALRRIGQARGTQYVLPGWAESGRGTNAREFVFGSHQRALVLRAARSQRLTNEKVRNLLDISPGQALEVLSELVQEGLLEKRGKARGTHYILTSQLTAENHYRTAGRIHLPRVEKRRSVDGH